MLVIVIVQHCQVPTRILQDFNDNILTTINSYWTGTIPGGAGELPSIYCTTDCEIWCSAQANTQ